MMELAPEITLIISMIALAGAALALAWRRRRLAAPSPSHSAHPGAIAEVEFSFEQLPSVSRLLGSHVAAGALDVLAQRVAARMQLAVPPRLGATGLALALEARSASELQNKIGLASAILGEEVTFAGAAFNFHVHAQTPDTAALAARETGPAQNAMNADRIADPCEARLRQLRELREGMRRGEVRLAYQPKLDLRTDKVCSAEALLRWDRPDAAPVDVGELVGLCEQTGAIRELTLWTIDTALGAIAQLRKAGHDIEVYVNVSAGLLADTGFADEFLNKVGHGGGALGIEITETAVIRDPDTAISNLNRFAAAGIAIAIDDFGAGLSSLEYLQQLPASELKIDRAFIDKLSSSHRNPLIIRATIDLAHALEMRVTAEGVDDQMSMALLRIMGCDMAQGYHIARPLDFPDLLEFLGQEPVLAGDTENQPAAAQEGR